MNLLSINQLFSGAQVSEVRSTFFFLNVHTNRNTLIVRTFRNDALGISLGLNLCFYAISVLPIR